MGDSRKGWRGEWEKRSSARKAGRADSLRLCLCAYLVTLQERLLLFCWYPLNVSLWTRLFLLDFADYFNLTQLLAFLALHMQSFPPAEPCERSLLPQSQMTWEDTWTDRNGLVQRHTNRLLIWKYLERCSWATIWTPPFPDKERSVIKILFVPYLIKVSS